MCFVDLEKAFYKIPENVINRGAATGGRKGATAPPNDFLSVFPNRLEPQSFFFRGRGVTSEHGQMLSAL